MLQLAQVIKKKNSGLEMFKIGDEERIKQFKIIFNIDESTAENLNKAFNIYISEYFKMIKFMKFYLNPHQDLNNVIFILSELDPKHKFVVNKYPSPSSVLVNFMVPTRLQIEPLGVKGEKYSISKITGQYYLRGAIITCLSTEDEEFEVTITYNPDDPNGFIDNYLDYIKNKTETLKKKNRILEILNRPPLIFEHKPMILNYVQKIPKSMLNITNVELLDIEKNIRVNGLDTELLLEYNVTSDEILANEISRDFNEYIFDRISTMIENKLYENLDTFDKYEITKRVLSNSETIILPVDRNTIRDYVLISRLIYMNIHDGILKVNPNNTIVLTYKSGKSGQSLLEYYIDFMIFYYKIIFHKDIKDAAKIIKNIYMSFTQTVRKSLISKISKTVMIIPFFDSCGLYNKYIESCIGPSEDKENYRELKKLNMMLINDADKHPEVQYYIWDYKQKLSRKYISKISSMKKYYSFDETPGDNARKLSNPIILSEAEIPEKITDTLPDLITEYRLLRLKVGDYDGLDTFGLFVKKMQRDKTHNPKTFNKLSYYKSAIQFLKTSIVELIYTKKLGSYATHFKNITLIENEKDVIKASINMRSYLFKVIEKLPSSEIITFLDDQKSLYDLYEILEYDVEYKKQKKLEQYEKRNNIYYNMTPEEKLILGIDKLHGEERINLLDRLIIEKEERMANIDD